MRPVLLPHRNHHLSKPSASHWHGARELRATTGRWAGIVPADLLHSDASAVPDRTAPFLSAPSPRSEADSSRTSTIGMSSPPPAKRPRSDSESAPGESRYARDDEFWFADGSIVLVAGNTTFRVYHGILATNSVVFHDMVQLPQPLTTPSLDGCPILDISDSPADLKHLLRVLFPKPAV